MFSGKIKYEVSDPAFYGSLIAEQKKRVREHSRNAEQWLELGRLYEARIYMTNDFATKSLAIRCFLFAYAILIIFSACIGYFVFSNSNLTPFFFIISMLTAILTAVILRWLWLLRYPPPGAKYFKKAIKLDPQCADAYMYLGLIALRRYQKRTACRFWEQAIRLNK
jgi:tetratricopeptide (TPR) repeat protein